MDGWERPFVNGFDGCRVVGKRVRSGRSGWRILFTNRFSGLRVEEGGPSLQVLIQL